MEEIQKNVLKSSDRYGFQIISRSLEPLLSCGRRLVARWIGRVADQWLEKSISEPPIRMLATRVLRLLVFGLAAVLGVGEMRLCPFPMVAGIWGGRCGHLGWPRKACSPTSLLD